jgi:hypothetical protein
MKNHIATTDVSTRSAVAKILKGATLKLYKLLGM